MTCLFLTTRDPNAWPNRSTRVKPSVATRLHFFSSFFSDLPAIFFSPSWDVGPMSTRIIIKNLPHNITPSRLKAHFSSSQSGNAYFSATVTDAKLVTDAKSGKSRGFAFVGYRTHEDAQKAVEWFNGTFVDMRKISVELAKPVTPSFLRWSGKC